LLLQSSIHIFVGGLPIFIGVIGTNNPLPFQTHSQWVCDLFTSNYSNFHPTIWKSGMDFLQESISKSMYKHSFSSIISKLFLDCHHIQLKFYASPSSNAWLSTYLITPYFRMAFDIFSSTLHTKLGLPHPMNHGLSLLQICVFTLGFFY
jgi:hypothetical protein